MDVTTNIADTRTALADARQRRQTIGLVPTMGALHDGHLSLVEAARRETDFVVATIFVNPTQFAPGEDFAAYPRTLEDDLAKCRDAGVDLVVQPSADEMYPDGARTTVHVAQLGDTLCGPHRPGHFDGVATVVTKLFQIVQPDRAYFGRKDFQQLAIIRQMVRDLNMPIDVVGCSTVREPDGLARSSRNAYLEPAERNQSGVVYASLQAVAEQIRAGQKDVAALERSFRDQLISRGPLTIDYASIVHPETLQPLTTVAGPVLLATAVRVGRTRLIDNLEVDPAANAD